MDRQQAPTAASQPSKDRSSEKLVGAKEALKQKLLRAVMKQAMEEIGSPDNIAEKAMSAIDTSKPPIPTAAERVQDLLLAEIAKKALDSIDDSDAASAEIAESLSMDRHEIQEVVSALRDRLANSIGEAAISQLADAERTADELSENLSISRPEIQNVVQALRDRIISSIRHDVLQRFDATDELVGQIGNSIDTDDPRFAAIQDQLLEQLRAEVQRQTLSKLENADEHVDAVRSQMDSEPAPVVAISDKLKDVLTAEARQRTLQNLEQIDSLVADVMGSLGDDLEAVSIAADRIRSTLVDEISKRATALISDADESARSARDRIGSDPAEVVEASTRLQAILLQEIARRSADGVGQDQEAVRKAMNLVDLQDESLVQVREGIKKRILTQVLSSAISEIHEEVAAAASEIGFGIDLDDVVFDLGSTSAETDSATDVSALDELIESDEDGDESLDDMLDALGEKKSLVGTDETEPGEPESGDEVALDADLESADEIASEADIELYEPAPSEIDADPVLGPTVENADQDPADKEFADPSDWQPLSEIDTSGAPAQNGHAHGESADTDNITELDRLDDVDELDEALETTPEAVAHSLDADSADAGDSESSRLEIEDEYEDIDLDNLLDDSEEEIAADSEQPQWSSEVHFVGMSDEDDDAPLWDSDTSEFRTDANDDSEWAPKAGAESRDDLDWAPKPIAASRADSDRAPEPAAESRDDSAWAPEPAGAEETDDLYYIYGILATAGPALEGPIPLGLNAGRVEGLDFDGLSAMISRVPATEFSGETLKTNLKDQVWLQENVRKHASIIAQIRERQTLLPMAFCTIHPDRESVLKMLEDGYDEYFDALDHVKGKQEWGLRIYRNLEVLQAKVSESDRRVEGAFSSISKSVVSYLRGESNRMNEGDNAMQLMTEHCTQRSHESILALATDGRKNPDGGGRARDNEDITLNMAYLVPDEREADVRAEVDRLQAEYLDLGFRFELTGPWPPYHFVTSDKARDAVRSQQ